MIKNIYYSQIRPRRTIIISKIFLLLFVLALFSCSTGNNYYKYNYFSGSKFYNDSLNISAKLFGDMKFGQPDRKTFRSFKKAENLKYRNLLFTATTFIEPFYDLMFFYDEVHSGQNSSTSDEIIGPIFHDSITQNVLFRKSVNGKSVSIYLIPRNAKSSVIEDAQQIIENVKFEISVKDDLTYSDVFNSYMGVSNILYVIDKFDTAPIPNTKQSEWMKFQYLATLLANDTSYPTYSEIITKFEKNREEHLKPIISDIIQENPDVEKTLEGTIQKIKFLAKEEKVVMLNEMHWLPKNRILATELLKPLKENGYNFLAVEAVNKDFIEGLNNRKFPTKNTGYYAREPFFGLFIRKALEMGYTIVAYDEFETDNREKAQAISLSKIIENDPSAKVFVYAGIDHILENNANKRMAQYFKEITDIDPLTIDQVELGGSEENETVFFPSGLVPKDKNINSGVDYFLINNLKPSLNMVFKNSKLSNFKIDLSELKNIQKEELYASIFILSEYEKYKSQAIPILNKIIKSEVKELSLLLPIGNFQVKVWNENNDVLLSRQIEVVNENH
ncbi:hypothetical protein QRD02_04525 [Aequorivita sp. SDUM287046]|uniref:Haem-binding uptake Tiki superfamily ChaN domain-containing protein n=1 Tax=Aequorivita aurantiaca TaxID=3053356 RepID=A0ABT8DKG9_9FLAO|nr:hypothetical protein [Aequorivita aurantiaca]MDN3723635.1 hypothetical protein [Aequorivita aurantiaca]